MNLNSFFESFNKLQFNKKKWNKIEEISNVLSDEINKINLKVKEEELKFIEIWNLFNDYFLKNKLNKETDEKIKYFFKQLKNQNRVRIFNDNFIFKLFTIFYFFISRTWNLDKITSNNKITLEVAEMELENIQINYLNDISDDWQFMLNFIEKNNYLPFYLISKEFNNWFWKDLILNFKNILYLLFQKEIYLEMINFLRYWLFSLIIFSEKSKKENWWLLNLLTRTDIIKIVKIIEDVISKLLEVRKIYWTLEINYNLLTEILKWINKFKNQLFEEINSNEKEYLWRLHNVTYLFYLNEKLDLNNEIKLNKKVLFQEVEFFLDDIFEWWILLNFRYLRYLFEWINLIEIFENQFFKNDLRIWWFSTYDTFSINDFYDWSEKKINEKIYKYFLSLFNEINKKFKIYEKENFFNDKWVIYSDIHKNLSNFLLNESKFFNKITKIFLDKEVFENSVFMKILNEDAKYKEKILNNKFERKEFIENILITIFENWGLYIARTKNFWKDNNLLSIFPFNFIKNFFSVNWHFQTYLIFKNFLKILFNENEKFFEKLDLNEMEKKNYLWFFFDIFKYQNGFSIYLTNPDL